MSISWPKPLTYYHTQKGYPDNCVEAANKMREDCIKAWEESYKTDDNKCACCHKPLDEQFKKTGIFKEHKELKELPQIIEVGKQCGYCIVPFGSMTRDIDLLAVPWVETAVSPEELIKNICAINPFILFKEPHQEILEKPFGRLSQVISVGGKNTYIDLTICSKFGTKPRPVTAEEIEKIIDGEPELPGDMPQDIIKSHIAIYKSKRWDLLAEVLRGLVRKTKWNIKKAIVKRLEEEK